MIRPMIIFRLDAGPAEGLGHLRRCIALATYLHGEGCEVRFICRSREAVPNGWLHDYKVLYLDEIESAGISDGSEDWDARATLLALGKPIMPAWVIVDHYDLGAGWEKLLREAGYWVAVIDDYRTRYHNADLLTSDSVTPFNPALNSGPADSVILTGPRYALLSTDYVAKDSRAVTTVERILITYGAADPTGETIVAIEAIGHLVSQGRLSSDVSIDVAIGPLNALASLLVAAAEERGQTAHLAPACLEALMHDANLVVTAGGNSMVEALAMLRPCVVTTTADNQKHMVSELQGKGLVKLAGEGGMVGISNLAETIAETIQSVEIWAQRINAARLFDHLGAKRIGEAILAKSGGKISLG